MDVQAQAFVLIFTITITISGKMEPYHAVTVHFVDKEWVLQSHCLQTMFVPEDHIAENLIPVFQGVLESWGLPENRYWQVPLLTMAQI